MNYLHESRLYEAIYQQGGCFTMKLFFLFGMLEMFYLISVALGF